MNARSQERLDDEKSRRQSDRQTAVISRAFGDALRVANGNEAEAIAMACLRSGVSVEDLYEKVISPAMSRVGALWEEGAITVADEHLATAITLRVMSSVYARSLRRSMGRPGRILMAAVEGQNHDIGLRMAGDVLELAGFEVIYLGGDMPLGSLVESVADYTPDLIALSTILDSNRENVEREINSLVESFPKTPIVLGGPAIPEGALLSESVEFSDGLGGLVALVAASLEKWGVLPREETDGPVKHEKQTQPSADLKSPEGRLLQAVVEATQIARSQARIARSYKELAYLDATTGGPNRRAFDDHLATMTRDPGNAPQCLMILDIDAFKQINDSHGHEAGDEVLWRVARSIEGSIRSTDFVGRLGGDEFGILMPGADIRLAEEVAERVLDGIRSSMATPDVAATIGICQIGDHSRQAMIQADTALYQAKNAGRDRVAIFGADEARG